MTLLLAVGSLLATASAGERNIAYSDDEVRFTVITPGTVRLEYVPDGKFVDNKSLMAVNREYEKTDYKVKVGSWVEITTPVLRLRYKKGSGAFTDKNLVITSASKQKVIADFMTSYAQLPELLKNKNQNEEQTKAFLEAIDWKK